jgi:hypothetical protein
VLGESEKRITKALAKYGITPQFKREGSVI